MKNKKTACFAVLLSLLLLAPVLFAQPLDPEASLKKNFPHLKYDGFQPSAVKGLYEVTAGTQILYYSPESEILMAGEMMTREGRNLTHERKAEVIGRRMKEIPLDKALKMGEGKNIVIEFSDPDCGYCRKSSEFLAARTDITRYVFFFPLSPLSEKKIRHILCAADREKAYKEAYAGKLDNEPFDACENAVVEEILKDHRRAAAIVGIEGTPFFSVNGHAVAGADLPLIEKLLNAK
jgi:thiol:disulfide interchange protein DsbC